MDDTELIALPGETCFETLRVDAGRAPRMAMHLDRLGVPEGDRAAWQAAITRCAAGRDGVVRIVARDVRDVASAVTAYRPLPTDLEVRARGVATRTAPRAAVRPTPARKTLAGRSMAARMRQEAGDLAPGTEVLLWHATAKGPRYLEGCTSSLLWRRGDLVTTVAEHVLPSVSVRRLAEVADAVGVTLQLRREGPSRDELAASDGVFLASAIVEIVPVASLDGLPLICDVELARRWRGASRA